MTTLAERLVEAMADAGISQAALARAVGVTPPSIHGWLNGKSKFLRGENLLRAASVLNVSDEWLATGKGTRARGARPAGRLASQPTGLSHDKIADAVRVANFVRDAALGPMTPDDYVRVLATAIQVMADQETSADIDIEVATKEVAARVRSGG